MKLISIVVPVFNEEENIKFFYSEVCKAMEQLPHHVYSFELLFIDDGSKDHTVKEIECLSAKDMRVRGLFLARNYGHQMAITCGLDHANGDAVITMDGDMQHPPSMIPTLIEAWENGFEVVQTIRVTTEGVSFFKRFTSKMFYRIINNISNVYIYEGGSDFRLLDKMVVEKFRQYRERGRFIRGMISAIGFRQVHIEFAAPERHAGVSKFSLKKMVHFALDGITAYSKAPLRFALYMGLLFGLMSVVVTLHVMYIKIFTEDAVPGWATISATTSLLGGIQLVGLGIIGEYIGRIFEEVKQRPLYVLRRYKRKKNTSRGGLYNEKN